MSAQTKKANRKKKPKKTVILGEDLVDHVSNTETPPFSKRLDLISVCTINVSTSTVFCPLGWREIMYKMKHTCAKQENRTKSQRYPRLTEDKKQSPNLSLIIQFPCLLQMSDYYPALLIEV